MVTRFTKGFTKVSCVTHEVKFAISRTPSAGTKFRIGLGDKKCGLIFFFGSPNCCCNRLNEMLIIRALLDFCATNLSVKATFSPSILLRYPFGIPNFFFKYYCQVWEKYIARIHFGRGKEFVERMKINLLSTALTKLRDQLLHCSLQHFLLVLMRHREAPKARNRKVQSSD